MDNLPHPFDLIEVEKQCFIESNNPMHAWAAYSLARVNKVDPPDWVMRYLDMVSRAIMKISADTQNAGAANLGPELARSMGFASAGRGSGFARYHDRWMVYGMNVRARMLEGDQEDHAIESVSNDAIAMGETSASYATVRRAWQRYDKLFPSDEVFPGEAIKKPRP